MNDEKQIDRRKFIRLSSGMITTLPFLAINTGATQELTELSETDPNALALGYKADANSVEVEAYPSFDSIQSCDNCWFYESTNADNIGPCKMFPGHTVSAIGWCSLYTPKKV